MSWNSLRLAAHFVASRYFWHQWTPCCWTGLAHHSADKTLLEMRQTEWLPQWLPHSSAVVHLNKIQFIHNLAEGRWAERGRGWGWGWGWEGGRGWRWEWGRGRWWGREGGRGWGRGKERGGETVNYYTIQKSTQLNPQLISTSTTTWRYYQDLTNH